MRLVCIDHYFEQDIGALRGGVRHSPLLLHSTTSRSWSSREEFFPDEVFTGIEAYFRPEHADARAAYRKAIDKELERLQAVYRFDALLAPSDTFFWIRALIEAAQTRGIPFRRPPEGGDDPSGLARGARSGVGRDLSLHRRPHARLERASQGLLGELRGSA